MYIQLLYVYNKGLLCCSFLLLFYYEFYYSFYYKAAENRGKQRITEDNGTFTEYREKAQKRYVSGLLKWLYHIIHETDINHLDHSSSLSVASCENADGFCRVLHFHAYFYILDILLNMSLCSSVHLSMYFLNFSLYFYRLSYPYLVIVFKYSYFFTDLYLSFFCLI